MNVMARLEIELAYYDAAAQYVSNYATMNRRGIQ